MADDQYKSLYSGLGGIWGVGSGSLGTGLVSLAFTYPAKCPSSTLSPQTFDFDGTIDFEVGGHSPAWKACTNIFGQEPYSEAEAFVVAIVLTGVVASLFALVWLMINSGRRQRRL